MADPQTEELLRSIDDQFDDLYGSDPLPSEAYTAPKVDSTAQMESQKVLVNEALKILRFPDPESPKDRLDPDGDWVDRQILKKADRPHLSGRAKILSSIPLAGESPDSTRDLGKESDEYKEWIGKYTPYQRREARELARSYYKNKEREEAKSYHKEYYQRLSDMYGPVVGDAFLGNMAAALEGSAKRSVATFSRAVVWKDKRDQKEWHEKGHALLRDTELMEEAASEVMGTGPWGRAFRGATSSVIEASAAGAVGGLPGIIGWFTLSRGSEAAYEADKAGLKGIDKTRYVVTSGAIEGGVTAAMSAIGLGGFESRMAGGVVRESLGATLKSLGIHGLAELFEEEVIALADASNRTLQGIDPTAAHPDQLGPLMMETFRTTLLAQGMGEGRAWVGRHYAKQEFEKAQELAKKDKLSRSDVEEMGVTAKTNEEQRNDILANLVQEVNRIKAGEPEVEPDLGPTKEEVIAAAEGDTDSVQVAPAEPAAPSPQQVQPTPLQEAPTETAPTEAPAFDPALINITKDEASKDKRFRVAGDMGNTIARVEPDGRIALSDAFFEHGPDGRKIALQHEFDHFLVDPTEDRFWRVVDSGALGSFNEEKAEWEGVTHGRNPEETLTNLIDDVRQGRKELPPEILKEYPEFSKIAVPPQAAAPSPQQVQPAPVEAAPAPAVEAQVDPDQVVEHNDDGTTVSVPVASVESKQKAGMSESAAVDEAAAEQDVPIDTSSLPGWQKALYKAGRGNTIVTNDQLGGILGEINQAVKDIAKGHTPGSVFPITDQLARATTKLLVYMAEAFAKSGVKLTKKKITEFLRQYPPFNIRDPRKKKAKRKSHWLITDADISKMLDRKFELEYVVTFEDGSQRIIMAESEEDAAYQTQAWQRGETPSWNQLAAQTDPTLIEDVQKHLSVKGVKAAKASSIMDRMKQIYKIATDLPSRRVVVNQQINWTEGETVEASARTLLKISLKRQERAAREGYTAAVVNEGMTWQGIIESAQQLPDGVEKTNVLRILSRLARARTGTPRGKVAMESAVKALNRLHEKYEHASALKELRTLKALVGKSKIDPKYKERIEEILAGLRLTKHKQKTIDRMRELLEAAAEDNVGQIPKALVDRANDVLAQYDDSVKPAEDMEAADLRAITYNIKALLSQMALKHTIRLRGEDADRAEVESSGGQELRDRSNKSRGVDSFSGKIKKKMNWFKRLLWFDQASADTLAHMLGGAKSVFYEVMSTRLRRSRDEFARIQTSALRRIRQQLEYAGISPEAFGSMSRIGGDNVVQVDIALPTARFAKSGKRKESLTLTVGEKIGLYLHLQDRYTRAEILADRSKGIAVSVQEATEGESVTLTIEDVVAIEESMTEQELNIAATLSVFVSETMGQLVNEEWVRQFGHELQMHENYWPRSRAKLRSETSPDNIMQQFLSESLAHLPIFKSRTTSPRAIVIHDAFGTFLSHVNSAGSFVTMHGATTDALSMLNSVPVQDALIDTQEHHGTWTQQLTETIADFRGLRKQTADASMETGLRKMINNSHIAALGLKAHIALYQTASFITAATQLGMGQMLSGLKGLNRETLAEIMEWSGTLAQRLTSGGMNIMSADYTGNVSLEFYGGVPNQRYGRVKRKVEQVSMWMIKKMDQAVIQSIWQAAKNEGIERGLEGEELMTFTRDRAVDVVDFTQPTWDELTTSTMGMVGRRAPALKMLATMFASQRNKNFNIMLKGYSDFMAADDKVEESKRFVGTLATVGIAQSAVVYGMGTMFQYALAAMWGDDEEMEEVEDLGYGDHAIEVLRKTMGNWLIFGDGINAAAGVFREKGMSPGFRRNRGTILSGVTADGMDAAIGFGMAFSQFWDGEEQTQWPSKGEAKGWDTLSEALDKFIRASGMVTGMPTGGLMQVFGRAMPHRGKKRWAYEPTHQLHELDREWSRSSPAAIEKKLDTKPGDLLLQAKLVAAKRTRQENQVAHDLWEWSEDHILDRLLESRRGKKADPIAEIGAMTHLNGVADAYQEYAKTGDATDLLLVADDGFKGKMANNVVMSLPLDQHGVTPEKVAEKKAALEENRERYLPIVKQMTREEAITALRWGHIQKAELKTLVKYAAFMHSRLTTGTSYEESLSQAMAVTDKQDLVDSIMSYRHTSGPVTGLPIFVPPGPSYGMKQRKLLELFE